MADIIIFENASVLKSGVSGTSNDLSGTLTTNDEGKYVLAIDEDTNLSDLVVEIEPTISNYSVTNPSGSDVQVSFDSDEQLGSNSGDIAVPIEDSGTNVVVALSRTDFSESGSGPYTYTATYTVSSDDTYTATLDTAKDPRGNDYGGSLSASATVDTTAPTAISDLSASGGSQKVDLSGTYPSESDLDEARVYRGQSAGFTRDSNSRLTTISSPTPGGSISISDDGSLLLGAPQTGTTYYYVIETDDTSDNTSVSNEASATPTSVSYPTVESTVANERFDSEVRIDIPTGVNGGDLLLATISDPVSSDEGEISAPSGWTKIDEIQGVFGPNCAYALFGKKADGTEGGTQVSIFGNGTGVSGVFFQVRGWGGNLSSDVEVASKRVDGTSTVDLSSLSPAWGSGKTLWLATLNHGNNGYVVNSFPPNYTNTFSVSNGTTTSAGSQRKNNVATEDPGVYEINGSDRTLIGATIGIETGNSGV